jgi:molybdenum cofactor cytidylyltransferase
LSCVSELQKPIFVSTTTHFALDQLSLADRIIRIDNSTDIEEAITGLDSGVILLIGDETRDHRVTGLSEHSLALVNSYSKSRGFNLFIEADGARLRPVKAPANHEPEIPAFVDGVIVVSGLTGLGKPLSEDWVHRVKLFSELSGLRPNDQISVEAIEHVLRHPGGGLKSIPPGARRYCLINQADTAQLQAQGSRIAKSLLATYDTCIVASLKGISPPDEESEGYAMGEFPNAKKLHAVHERQYGIVLAAGGSDRMGRTKQLLSWRGEPLVRKVVRTALSGGLMGVTAVVGASADEVNAAIEDLPIEIVFNPAWQDGQSTSLEVGLKNLPQGAGGAVFLLADQPFIPATLIRTLVDMRSRTLAPIVIPLVGGNRGNPVLFGWQTFEDLLAIQGDQGGRSIFSNYPLEWVEWHDPNVLQDIDTPDDYQRLLSIND